MYVCVCNVRGHLSSQKLQSAPLYADKISETSKTVSWKPH